MPKLLLRLIHKISFLAFSQKDLAGFCSFSPFLKAQTMQIQMVYVSMLHIFFEQNDGFVTACAMVLIKVTCYKLSKNHKRTGQNCLIHLKILTLILIRAYQEGFYPNKRKRTGMAIRVMRAKGVGCFYETTRQINIRHFEKFD